jgi:drug/metabolite transporter (DMT)-like permease
MPVGYHPHPASRPIAAMSVDLRPATLFYLTLPPLMWASNAIVGRLSVSGGDPLISPIALNTLRWVLVLVIVTPIVLVLSRRGAGRAGRAAAGAAANAPPRGAWRTYAIFGLLSVASYNALQYMALRTSTAINVTLIAAGGPLFVLLIGRMFFGAHARRWAWIGAGLSLAGVLVVLTRGEFAQLARLRVAGGDLLMVAATIVWALYSWLLRERRPDVPVLTLLLLQTAWGVALSLPIVGVEWLSGQYVLRLEPLTLGIVVWVALGPSLLAYWCWDRGVSHAGPLLPSFFANLTPLLTALMSAALLGEPPHLFHGLAFLLIVAGIAVSQRGARA